MFEFIRKAITEKDGVITLMEFNQIIHDEAEKQAKYNCMNRFVDCSKCNEEVNSDYAKFNAKTNEYICLKCSP